MKLLIAFIFFIFLNPLFAQEYSNSENETHIFWNPKRQLTKNDFKGDESSFGNAKKYCEELNFCTCGSFGIFSVLDIPKKRKNRGKLYEKAYFVPAFEKNTSWNLKNDSVGIKQQQLVYDIFELSTRYSRQKLKQIQDTIKGYGSLSIWYYTVKTHEDERRANVINQFTNEVIIKKEVGAFEKWKLRIESLLNELQEFATTEEDYLRFISGKPIDERYEIAKTITGNLFDK